MCTRLIRGRRFADGTVRLDTLSGGDEALQVKCGYCPECLVEKRQHWATRIYCENLTHDESCFLTLTYDDDHLPPDLSLERTAFPKFARSLRKRTGRKLRYYHCGEYGDEGGRPHYHAVLFGCDFAADRVPHRRTPYGMLYTSDFLAEVWGQGFCTIGDVTPQSAAYVAGYIEKKLFGSRARRGYAIAWDVDPATGLVEPCLWREPPFSTMSLKPGIGQPFLERFGHEVYAHDQVVVEGVVRKPPPYFDRWLEARDPVRLEAFKGVRQDRTRNRWRDRLPERQEARERVHRYANARRVRELTGVDDE